MSCHPPESLESLRAERDALRDRLAEDKEVFAAIRSGKADVVLVDGAGGHRVAAFSDSSETYRLIIESIDQGAATLAPDGTVLYANRSLALMFGIPLGRLIGSSLFQHIPRDYHTTLREWLGNHGGEKRSGEWRLPCGATDGILLHAVISPLPVRSGASYSLVVTDIGPVLERETLRRNQINLEREAIELTAAKHAAEQGSRAKSIFLATMSHELRTPMNAIIGFNDLLLMTENDPGRREQMNIIKEASNSLLQIIRNILDLSKIEAGQTEVQDENFVLCELVSAVSSMFEVQASTKMISYSVSIDPLLPLQICGDSGLLKQILINLIGNAIKFTNAGSVNVRIERYRVSSIGSGVPIVFHIQDTGIGIKPENQDRIFEIFEQEDGSFTRRFGGSGLGLSISKRLVTLLDGEIWVRSTPGVGSCFSFAVTCKPVEIPHTEASATIALEPPRPSSKCRVLVVDDDLYSRKLLTDALETHSYSVSLAEDGDQALRLLGQQKVDLILLDIQLPVVSGLDVVRTIRSGGVPGCDPAILIIAVTAYAMGGDREHFLSNGMTDYLSKPINITQMLATIARHCDGTVQAIGTAN